MTGLLTDIAVALLAAGLYFESEMQLEGLVETTAKALIVCCAIAWFVLN